VDRHTLHEAVVHHTDLDQAALLAADHSSHDH
jgi:hypothetical protein